MTESKIKVLPNELVILLVLAGLQFSHIVDFMIMMPLGPQLIRSMSISSQQFAALVSVYTFSAGITNLFGAFLLDRYDRKKSTLLLYMGFIVGTLACGFAPGYEFLLVSRAIAGAFGGLGNAAILSIVGDYIPNERRARAMGIVMASFSVASILGVPLSLWLAGKFGWHAPFFFVGGASLIFSFSFYAMIPPLTRHLHADQMRKTFSQSFSIIGNLLKQGGPQRALLLISSIMLSQFSVVPFLTSFYVFNVKFPETHIPFIYMFGGLLTVFTSPYVGKLADRHGRARIFSYFALITTLPIFMITHLPAGAKLWVVLLWSGTFFVTANGRFVPAMTMITSVVPPERRGTFMSLVSCVQQVFAGVGAYVAGLLLSQNASGELSGFAIVGSFAIVVNLLALALGVGLERKALST